MLCLLRTWRNLALKQVEILFPILLRSEFRVMAIKRNNYCGAHSVGNHHMAESLSYLFMQRQLHDNGQPWGPALWWYQVMHVSIAPCNSFSTFSCHTGGEEPVMQFDSQVNSVGAQYFSRISFNMCCPTRC